MSISACKGKVFASSVPSLSIFAQVFGADTEICPNVNRTKQSVSPFRTRYCRSFMDHKVSQTRHQENLVFLLPFLSSESYSPIVNPAIHQAYLSCSSQSMYVSEHVLLSEHVSSEYFAFLLQSDVVLLLSTVSSPGCNFNFMS